MAGILRPRLLPAPLHHRPTVLRRRTITTALGKNKIPPPEGNIESIRPKDPEDEVKGQRIRVFNNTKSMVAVYVYKSEVMKRLTDLTAKANAGAGGTVGLEVVMKFIDILQAEGQMTSLNPGKSTTVKIAWRLFGGSNVYVTAIQHPQATPPCFYGRNIRSETGEECIIDDPALPWTSFDGPTSYKPLS